MLIPSDTQNIMHWRAMHTQSKSIVMYLDRNIQVFYYYCPQSLNLNERSQISHIISLIHANLTLTMREFSYIFAVMFVNVYQTF